MITMYREETVLGAKSQTGSLNSLALPDRPVRSAAKTTRLALDETRLKQGTTTTLELPQVEAEPKAAPAPEARPAATTDALCIGGGGMVMASTSFWGSCYNSFMSWFTGFNPWSGGGNIISNNGANFFSRWF